MKKILLLIIGLVFTVSVYSAENKLYFTEDGKNIYYDSRFLNENYFMKYLDMVPGYTATDELIIENGSNTTCKLFFRVEPREQNKYADELLNNIAMKIYVDNSLIYDGMAKGLDYNLSGVNLQDLIEIGTFTPSKVSFMKSEITLSTSYTNPEHDDTAIIDWVFYGQCDDSSDPIDPDEPSPSNPEPSNETTPKEEKDVVKIIKAPQTGINTNIVIYIIIVLLSLIILITVLLKDRKIKQI